MSNENLDKEELEIFTLVKEYLAKKSISHIIELVNFINHRLRNNPNYNRNKIESIIKILIKKKIILIGTKLSKEDILNIQIRKSIFESIEKNPGININDLKKEFNLGSNQALWHIKMLNDFNYIKLVQIENQKALFKYDFDEKREKLVFYLRNEKIRDIIKLLENAENPLKPTIVSEQLNIHYNTIKKYLDILLKYNIIMKVNGNKKKRYMLNQELDSELMNWLES